MRKIVIITVSALIAFILLNAGLPAKQRGIRVVAKSGESLYLYKDYHALVVGVGDYTQGWPDLPGAVKDAEEVASSLKELGFKVNLVLNPTSSQLKATLNEIVFGLGRDTNRALLLYYAGHGETLELADGTELGYIVPTDVPLKSRDPMRFDDKAISMKEIESVALKVRSKHFLMVFDSCFSGSLFNLVRAAPVDITEKSARPVRQFITAGEAGEQVPDKSIFKIVFLDGIKGEADLNSDGYVTGSELGMHLQGKVVNYTRGGQHPQYGKINNPKLDKGDFVFLAGGSIVVEIPVEPAQTGSLLVETYPSGAVIYVDGKSKGRSPVTLSELSPGRLKVKATLNGYEAKEEVVHIRSRRQISLSLVLDKVVTTGTVVVESEPASAKWYLDGAYMGTTPDEMKNVEQGIHRVKVKKDGFRDWSKDISIRPGKSLVVKARLKRLKEEREFEKVITWNFSLWGGKRVWTRPLHDWAAAMEQKTNGRWKIKLHYGAVLAPPKEQLDGIRAGRFEAAAFCAAYHPGKLPLHTVAELPFIAPDENIDIFQMVVELWKHPAIKKELLKWHAVPLLAGGLCQYHLMGNKAVRTAEDLKGKRIRMGGEIGKVLRAMGAVPTLVPAPEVYEALSRGTIDLVGFPWTYAYGAYKCHEVSKYATFPISLGTMNCPYIANKDAWDALPEEFKRYHMEWYDKSPRVWAAEYKKADDRWLPIFRKRLEFIDFPASERNKIVAKAEEFYERWVKSREKEGLPGREVLNYYLKKRKEITGQ